jgi:hypothetical protein
MVSIQPVAFGSYSYQASIRFCTSSPAMTPSFVYLAASSPSITAATARFMMSQAMIIVKDKK